MLGACQLHLLVGTDVFATLCAIFLVLYPMSPVHHYLLLKKGKNIFCSASENRFSPISCGIDSLSNKVSRRILSLGESLPTCDDIELACWIVSFPFSTDFTVQK